MTWQVHYVGIGHLLNAHSANTKLASEFQSSDWDVGVDVQSDQGQAC